MADCQAKMQSLFPGLAIKHLDANDDELSIIEEEMMEDKVAPIEVIESINLTPMVVVDEPTPTVEP